MAGVNADVVRLFGRVNVIVATAARTLTRSESGSLVTNTGAAGQVIVTLPSAEAGLVYHFKVNVAQNLRIKAASGDTIRIGTGSAGSAAGYVEADAIGESITLVALNATEWHTEAGSAAVGTFTAG